MKFLRFKKQERKRMFKRTLFVGDVHGCYTELKGLLEMTNFKPDSERLFLSET